MASRPRPSLLALFDPLTISETSPSTPTVSSPSPSPDSGSDKENLISTTPKYTDTKSYDGGCFEAFFVKRTHSRVDHSQDFGGDAQTNSFGKSFSLEPKNDDASNLCLVQLADELESACKIAEDIIDRGEGPREPLSEICIIPTNSNIRTPQSVARDKRLIVLDTPTTTPKSALKFAAGVAKYEPSTPPVSSPLASLRAARTPRNLLSPKVNSPSTTLHTQPNAAPYSSVSPAPSLPFASQSPALMSSTPASDSSQAFQDPLSGLRGSSFEIHSSLGMKKMDLSGDLLNDDMSFLARLEEDSFADFARGNSSDNSSNRTTGSSPRTPQEMASNTLKEVHYLEKPCSPQQTNVTAPEEELCNAKTQTPARTTSTAFCRSSSHFSLGFGSEGDENPTSLASPIDLQPRTPSSSPLSAGNNKRGQAHAPKKSHAMLRRNSTLSRSSSNGIAEKVKEQIETGLGASQHTKPGSLRLRPSSIEIKPLARSQSLAVKQPDTTVASTVAPPASVRRTSISQPSINIGRRTSVGHELSSAKPKAFDPLPSQGHNQNQKLPQAPLAQSARRSSVSTSAKPTPAKGNNFATTGRLGGARRVPITANAPLFKTRDSTINEVQSPIPRASTLKTGPQRPSAGLVTSATLGRSTFVPPLNRATSTSSRTLGRTSSASSVAFSRSSFMTSSGSSNSRLPMPPTKTTSKIPGPGARKAF